MIMDKLWMNGHASSPLVSDEDFELMGDIVREDPVIVERRRLRNNEITKKLGAYLLKGYCMLSDACRECDCILLRTPERELLCVGCTEVDVDREKSNNKAPIKEGKDEESTPAEPNGKKKERAKRSKKRSKNASSTSEADSSPSGSVGYSAQIETKLKWAVDELAKSHNPNRISAMCTVIVKLTESIKALKEYEAAFA